MGMFDDITSKYPLPIKGANALDFQTKDTPAQFMERYEIREDGTLWHEDGEYEDRSARMLWKNEHPGEPLPKELADDGLSGFWGCMTHVNKRWVPVPMTGEIVFGQYDTKTRESITFSAYFVAGKLNQLHVLEHETLT